MHIHRITISVPQQLYEFVESYQAEHCIKNRSEVLARALQLLQQKQLETFYAQASQELSDDFDGVAGDGLDDEAW